MISFLLGIGVLFFMSGLAVPAASLVTWLDPQAIGPHRISLVQGAMILKACLVIDGVLLFAAAGRWELRRRRPIAPRKVAPLWTRYCQTACADVTSERAFAVGLGGLLCLATLLRWPGLDTDLWVDEILTLINYVRITPGQIVTSYATDNNHILYSLLAKASISFFGESAVALRLPAVVCGVASIYAVGRLSALAFGRREALFVAALLSVSYTHVWFSQNARAYTILLLGTIVATELLLRGLSNGRFSLWAAYAITLALTSWAHLSMIFVGFAHGLVVVALAVPRGTLQNVDWRPFAALVMAGWLVIHLYALPLPQLLGLFSQPGGGSFQGVAEWKNPLWMVTEVIRHMRNSLAFGWVGLVVAGAVLAWGLVCCARRDIVLTAAMVLPAVISGTAMLLLGRNLWPRLFFNELGFAAMFAVLGAFALGDKLGRLVRVGPRVGGIGLVVLLCVVAAASLPKVYLYPKQDFTGARDFVRARAAAVDRVLVVGKAGKAFQQYYARDWPHVGTLAELQAHRAVDGRTWVLYTLPRVLAETAPDLVSVLESEFDLLRVFPGTLGGGEVIVRRGHGQDNIDP